MLKSQVPNFYSKMPLGFTFPENSSSLREKGNRGGENVQKISKKIAQELSTNWRRSVGKVQSTTKNVAIMHASANKRKQCLTVA